MIKNLYISQFILIIDYFFINCLFLIVFICMNLSQWHCWIYTYKLLSMRDSAPEVEMCHDMDSGGIVRLFNHKLYSLTTQLTSTIIRIKFLWRCKGLDVPNKLNAKYYVATANENIYKYILLNALPRVYQTLSLYLKMSNFLVPSQFVRISTSIISNILRMSLVD